jgi:hypothetical protein
MKNLRMTLTPRDRERGAVALLVAVMWTALFGMAVMAVDFGYLYTKKRGMQGAVDGALKAAMPAFQAAGGGSAGASAAQNRARAVALLSGFQNAEVSFPAPALPATQFAVQIQRSHPTFFGGLFGIGSKTLSAQATGELVSSGGGAVIHANDAACMGEGFTIQGMGVFNVSGNVESNGILSIGWLAGACYPAPSATCRISGTAKAGCAGNPQNPSLYTISGGASIGGPFPDPLAAVTPATLAAFCDHGSLITNPADPVMSGGIGLWTCGAGPGGSDTLQAGVYCSSGNINVSSPCGTMNVNAPDSTFISNGGTITFGANNGIRLGFNPKLAATKIIALATGPGAGCGMPAMNVGFANAWTVNGVIYAPNGCINGGGGGTAINTFNGQLVGNRINLAMNPGSTWNFIGGGGPSGSGWHLFK